MLPYLEHVTPITRGRNW